MDVMNLLPPIAERIAFKAEALLAYMDATGVEKAVLLQAPLYGNMNDYVGTTVGKWPDRFAGAIIMNPRARNARKAFDRAVSKYEFAAIKLELSESTGLCGVYPDLVLDGPSYEWIWERAEELRLTVTVDLGAIGSRSYQTEAVDRLARRYPRLHWVIAHLGQPTSACDTSTEAGTAWRNQVLLGKLPNVWLDLSSLAARFPKERYPYPSAQAFLRQSVRLIGADKILWGTDAPGMLTLMTYRQMLDLVASEADYLTTTERELILGDNALVAYRLNSSGRR